MRWTWNTWLWWTLFYCSTEWNKGSKPGVVSCLLWEADELSSASLGAFHWLLLWLIQAASAKTGAFCLPFLSVDMCSVEICSLFVLYDVPLLSCLPGWHCSGAKVAVRELMLWVWVYNKKELQRPFWWTFRDNAVLVSLVFAASRRSTLDWRIVYYSKLSITSESCFAIPLSFHSCLSSTHGLFWWSLLCGSLIVFAMWVPEFSLAAKPKPSRRCSAAFLGTVQSLLWVFAFHLQDPPMGTGGSFLCPVPLWCSWAFTPRWGLLPSP